MAKLFTTSRWLRPYESKQGCQVFIRVRIHNGLNTEIPVYDYINHKRFPISVKKENWLKGYVKGGSYHISIADLNHLLSQTETKVKYAVYELIDKNIRITRENILKLAYINEDNALVNEQRIASGELIVDEQGGAFASKDEFVEYIATSPDPKFNSLKKAIGLYEKQFILDYWDDFIHEYAPNSYNSTKHSIEEYIRETDNNCKIQDFSAEWLEDYFDWIVKNGYSLLKDGTNRQYYTISTINKYLKHLKAFGDYLFSELKIINNQDYRRCKLRKNTKKQSLLKYNPEPFSNTHALYKREFDWFYFYKFEDEQLALVRDMFILQTWLGGLRQCDFFEISEINFHKDSNGKYKIWFEQKKTDDDVLNVVNQNYLIPLLEKYTDKFKDFPKVHIYNKLLKRSAEKAGLKRKLNYRLEYANGKEATIKWFPIYEKITNKWARQCAVSILAELGYPDDRISKFSGHRDLDMIKHYKKIHQKDINLMMEEVKPEIVNEL
jgi:hypothetical protein